MGVGAGAHSPLAGVKGRSSWWACESRVLVQRLRPGKDVMRETVFLPGVACQTAAKACALYSRLRLIIDLHDLTTHPVRRLGTRSMAYSGKKTGKRNLGHGATGVRRHRPQRSGAILRRRSRRESKEEPPDPPADRHQEDPLADRHQASKEEPPDPPADRHQEDPPADRHQEARSVLWAILSRMALTAQSRRRTLLICLELDRERQWKDVVGLVLWYWRHRAEPNNTLESSITKIPDQSHVTGELGGEGGTVREEVTFELIVQTLMRQARTMRIRAVQYKVQTRQNWALMLTLIWERRCYRRWEYFRTAHHRRHAEQNSTFGFRILSLHGKAACAPGGVRDEVRAEDGRAWMKAAREGKLSQMMLLLDGNPLFLSYQEVGFSALYWCADRGHTVMNIYTKIERARVRERETKR